MVRGRTGSFSNTNRNIRNHYFWGEKVPRMLAFFCFSGHPPVTIQARILPPFAPGDLRQTFSLKSTEVPRRCPNFHQMERCIHATTTMTMTTARTTTTTVFLERLAGKKTQIPRSKCLCGDGEILTIAPARPQSC